MRRGIEIVSASAGTGKTTKLAHLISDAVVEGEVRSEAVLATTFTNRAAAELAERARETLLKAGESDAAHRLHAARVGTVNSVCGAIVRDFAFHHGLSPRVSVLEERKTQDEPLHAGAEALPSELVDELWDLHSRMGPIGAHPGGFMAPGEWDWQQDVVRIVDLARSNAIAPALFPQFAERSTSTLLGFLQTPTTAAETLDRALETSLDTFLGSVDLDADSTKKTREACQRVRFARARGPSALSWADWVHLAQLDPAKKSRACADPVREAAASHDRHPRLHQDLRNAIRAVFAAAAHLLDAYQAHKRSLGVIDFVDQETEALTLLRDDAVRQQLSEEVDLVLVDEFQDTSPIQLAIFLELYRIAPRSVWVGDPKQAIYGFRGADPSLMDAAVSALLDGASPETLDRSYRSRPALVRLTSELFAPAFAESGIPEELVRVEAANEAEPEGLGPVFERWVLAPGVNEKTGRPRRNAELDLISLASGVSALLEDPDARVRDVVTGEARCLRPGDVAVLCFRNDQCTGLARELEARGIRAVVGRPGLLGTLEVQLAIAAIRLWIDPSDSLARAEIARWFEGGGQDEAWFSTVLAASDTSRLFEELPPLVALREARAERTFRGLLAAFDSALASVGVRERVVTFGDATARLANLDALRAMAASYVDLSRDEGAACSLRGFVVHLKRLAAQGIDAQAAAERPDAVRLCTLHGSKGLEWPITVLADLTDRPDVSALGVRVSSESDTLDVEDPLAGRWLRYWPGPYGRKRKDVPFLERLEDDDATRAAKASARREALRLVYVGWTRARDRLVYAGRPGRIEEGGLVVLSADGNLLLSEPEESGRVVWGRPDAPIELQTILRNLPPIRVESREPVPSPGYTPLGPRRHPPAFVSPSQLDGVGVVEETIEIGERVPVSIRDDDEMRRFGDAVHGFLAADRPTLAHVERENIARELLERFGVAGSIEAGRLPELSNRLVRWVDSCWPAATWRREWPLLHRQLEGTIVRGAADLVVETGDGAVVIDHKSFPGNRPQATERAASFAGQLGAYAAAIEASGVVVLGAYVHLPISGLICRVASSHQTSGGE